MDNINNNSPSHAHKSIEGEQLKNKVTKTNQIWYDADKNKHYLIDWKGSQVKCGVSGKEPPTFKPALTGYATFNQRNNSLVTKYQNGIQVDGTLKSTPSMKLLKDPPKQQYLPQISKFEGYVQFRCPLKKNIDNNETEVEQSPTQSKFRQLKQSKLNTSITKQLPRISASLSQSYRDQNQSRYLSKQNVSALYKSYKDTSQFKSTDYFQQQRKSQFRINQQSAVLQDYAKYLQDATTTKYKYKQTDPQPEITGMESSIEVIKQTAPILNQDHSVEKLPQRKIAELSLKIINQQEREAVLKEAPYKEFLNYKQKFNIKNRVSEEQGNNNINKSITQMSIIKPVSHTTSVDTFQMQSLTGIRNNSQSTLVNPNIQSNYTTMLSKSSPNQKSQNRYKNYEGFKSEQRSSQTYNEYMTLKVKNQDQINMFMTSSPRNEFEKDVKQNQLLENEEESQQFTIEHKPYHSIHFGNRSVSPNIKTLTNFADPFKLQMLRDPNQDMIDHLEKLKTGKQKLKGHFNESLQRVRYPGENWVVDKKWQLRANPYIEMILKKKEDFELKRVKNKHHQKGLQQMACEQDMAVLNRKIYKQYIKY